MYGYEMESMEIMGDMMEEIVTNPYALLSDMEVTICQIIKAHPGIRNREIAHDLRVWHCNKEFLDAMNNLECMGYIRVEYFADHAQMEFYNKWYAVE